VVNFHKELYESVHLISFLDLYERNHYKYCSINLKDKGFEGNVIVFDRKFFVEEA